MPTIALGTVAWLLFKSHHPASMAREGSRMYLNPSMPTARMIKTNLLLDEMLEVDVVLKRVDVRLAGL